MKASLTTTDGSLYVEAEWNGEDIPGWNRLYLKNLRTPASLKLQLNCTEVKELRLFLAQIEQYD